MSESTWLALRIAFEQWTGVHLPDAQEDGAVSSLVALAQRRRLAPAACLEHMAGDRDLRQELIDAINLGLTWFLRDRDGLESCARDIARAHADDPERGAWLWSIGCSTGEEPYSLAMLLDDFGIEARILATDINRRFLAHALDGIYPDRALRRVPELYRHRYFEPAGAGRVRVRAPIRRRVTFELHNIAESQQPPRGWSQFDGVVCRNLLMFVDRQRALSIIRGLTAACRPGGYMILGAIERPLLWATRQLDVRDTEEPIVQVPRHVPPRRAQTVPMMRLSAAAPERKPAPGRDESGAPRLPGRVRDAYDLVQAGVPARALAILDAEVENHPLSPLVQLSRGLALKQTGKLRDAVTAFRAARFLEAEAWLAPYQLGLCLEALGDADDACEAYRHAMSVLDRGGPSGLSGLGDDIESLRLSISSACRSRLQSLAKQTAT